MVKRFKRVGAGPFPTELDGAIAGHCAEPEELTHSHHRGRRGALWLDLVLRYTHNNGFSEFFITKLMSSQAG